MRLPFLLFFSAIILALSCSKSKNEGQAKTRKEIIASDKWGLTAAKAKLTSGSQVQEVDLMVNPLFDCSKDDFLLFYPNMNFSLDEGPKKCDTTKPQITPGTWEFLNGETRLKVVNNLNGNALIADIISINDNTMTLKYDTSYVTVPAEITTTWTHIK